MKCDSLTLIGEQEILEKAENLKLDIYNSEHREELNIKFLVNTVNFRLRDVQTFVEDENYYGLKCIVVHLYSGLSYVCQFSDELYKKLDYEINVR